MVAEYEPLHAVDRQKGTRQIQVLIPNPEVGRWPKEIFQMGPRKLDFPGLLITCMDERNDHNLIPTHCPY